MNASSMDIKDILEAESSLGLVYATNLFVGKEPASPSGCVTIFDIPGRSPLLTLDGKGGIAYDFSSIQIRVRNRSYNTAWDTISSIKEYLHGIKGETWNTTVYDLIKGVDDPFLLDWDENDNARFVTTFTVQRK